MKNVLYLILAIPLFCSCGTDQGEGENYTFTLINSSGHDITIESYSPDRQESNLINIQNDEEIIKQFRSSAPPMEEIHTFLSFFQGDSIVVIYDNVKRNSFTQSMNCDEEERNPLNTCLYRETEEIFTFTEQDYENAEFCNANCN